MSKKEKLIDEAGIERTDLTFDPNSYYKDDHSFQKFICPGCKSMGCCSPQGVMNTLLFKSHEDMKKFFPEITVKSGNFMSIGSETFLLICSKCGLASNYVLNISEEYNQTKKVAGRCFIKILNIFLYSAIAACIVKYILI